MTISIVGTNTILLPDVFHWEDRFKWLPINVTQTTALDGGVIFETGALTGGRPITLKGEGASGWLPLSLLEALYEELAIPGVKVLSGTHIGGPYNVLVRAPGITATPVIPWTDGDDPADNFSVELAFVKAD